MPHLTTIPGAGGVWAVSTAGTEIVIALQEWNAAQRTEYRTQIFENSLFQCGVWHDVGACVGWNMGNRKMRRWHPAVFRQYQAIGGLALCMGSSTRVRR